jgi:hypothetical protein
MKSDTHIKPTKRLRAARNRFMIIASTLLTILAVGAVYSFYGGNNKHSSLQENSSSGGSSIGIDNGQSNQTIQLYSPTQKGSDQQAPSNPAEGSSTIYRSPTYHDANLGQYLPPDYSSNPLPTTNSSSTTLQVPPQPNCGGNADSSYYANCMDAYCYSYPSTSVCIGRH